MADERIADSEVLYRSVRADKDCKYDGERSRYRVSSQAFNDKIKRQPSVDRAIICKHDPALAKLSPTDGVVSLLTESVRSLAIEHQQNKHVIDAIYDPIYKVEGKPDNIAHSYIGSTPAFGHERAFEKLKQSLARLADDRWELQPVSTSATEQPPVASQPPSTDTSEHLASDTEAALRLSEPSNYETCSVTVKPNSKSACWLARILNWVRRLFS